MKIKELRNLSQAELLEKEKSLKEELFKLNLQRYSGRVERPHLFSVIKKDIARVKTLLRDKEKKTNG
ncbi:MAG: 50S ribosomal protein L29 [Candidatus Omnitrophota bacterium]